MKLAKYVFTGAGIWDIVVLAPLYWLLDMMALKLSGSSVI